MLWGDRMKKHFAGAASLAAVLALIAAALLRAGALSAGALEAMQLAASVVIPSLFPLCVLSNYLVERGAASRWEFLRPLCNAFRLEATCLPACIFGFLSGYPVGAVVISRLYERSEISRESAARALAFCNNASPAFLVAVAGGTLLRAPLAGFLLLLVHWLSAIAAGRILAHGRPTPHMAAVKPQFCQFAAAFTGAVQRASLAMIHVAGFIVLFSVVIVLGRPLLTLLPGDGILAALLTGGLEVTNGLTAVAALQIGIRLKFVLFSALLGWSGLCVHLQVLSFTLPLGIPARGYLRGKLLQCACAAALACPASLLLQDAAAAAAIRTLPERGAHTLFLWVLIAAFLFFYLLFPRLHDIMKKSNRR